jgi:hypothetical protein
MTPLCLKHSPPHAVVISRACSTLRVCLLQGISHEKRKCNGDSAVCLDESDCFLTVVLSDSGVLPTLVSVEANICLIGITCSNIIYLF